MGNQRRFEARAWASAERARTRAPRVWGEAGLTAFHSAAGTRTAARFREALESLAQTATMLEVQIRTGLGEMKRVESRLSGRHV